jgi:hypothetical protein
MAPPIGIGDVDAFSKHGVTLADLPTRADIELAIGFNVEGVRAVASKEPGSPVIGNACLEPMLVIKQNGVGAVACTRHGELGNRVAQGVVVVMIALDDRIVQDRTEARFPEAMLDREFPAVDRVSLI